MEIFEIHITGSENIHDVARRAVHKTIEVELLRPDRTVMAVEHMTSIIYKTPAFLSCKQWVENLVQVLIEQGITISRTKIESPYYEHYVEQSLYMESHFLAENNEYPLSRNRKKTTYLATDRTYDKSLYNDFKEKYKDKELELCLFDSNMYGDIEWLNMYSKYNNGVI